MSVLGACAQDTRSAWGSSAALIAPALDHIFGLLGGNASQGSVSAPARAPRSRHGSLATSIGDPTTLMRGAKANDQLIHQAAKNNQIRNGEARTLMTCLHRIDH